MEHAKIEPIIKKAVEGGWKNGEITKGGLAFSYVTEGAMLLDPQFWQSLGKAMGWKHCRLHAFQCIERPDYFPNCKVSWTDYWHKFIDHLTEGKSIESYFEKLD